MQIKRYKELSMKDAVVKIKKDLGPDAVILSNRRLSGNEHPYIEVIAGRDEKYFCQEKTLNSVQKEVSSDVMKTLTAEVAALKTMMGNFRKDQDYRSEMAEFREMFEAMFDSLGDCAEGGEKTSIKRVYYYLLSTGISKKRASQLVEKMKILCPPEKLKNYDEALKIAKVIVKRSIDPFYQKLAKSRITAFVGPTGVGKTTTLAKLAARYSLKEKKSVGIITMDTFRIGATEQLKIYSDIMNIPMEIISENNGFADAVNRFSDKDIILVDTPGRSPNDEVCLSKIGDTLREGQSVETRLVLSVTASEKNMDDTISRYGIIPYDDVIFTKLDEVRCFGSLYNAIQKAGKPVYYITNGQNVPQDIAEINSEMLANMIVGTVH